MASITCLMLIIAAFTSDLTEESVKQSIENVKITDIKKWSKEKIGDSLFEKRKVLLAADYEKMGGTFLSELLNL